jgi:hypothetical protein
LSETSAPEAAPPLGETEDFCVEECLEFEPAGAGAHVLLRVRKRDANTAWAVEELSECPLALVATGADRDDTIVLRDPFA